VEWGRIRVYQNICSLVENPPVVAGKATNMFCGNMKMLLFEDEEYKGSIFRN
jgi:hypothetical protein